MNTNQRTCRLYAAAYAVVSLAAMLAPGTLPRAATTDLAPVPMVTASPQVVKPNLMFILDDSGSMAWSYMPDTVEGFARKGDGTKKYGFVSSQCNGVYYDPTRTYTPPIKISSSGAASVYPNSSFTSAWVNGFDTSAGTVNLETSFRAWSNSNVNDNGSLYNNADTAQPAYYYTYSGTENTPAKRTYLNTSSTFYTECNADVGTLTTKFTKVTITTSSAPAVQTNFANWYSYYRTRMLMMKTASGRAFLGIDDTFRVGYMSINNNVSPSFLNIEDFGGTQKYEWYAKLYGAVPDNSTPLRRALSNAGRIYGGQVTSLYNTTVKDPVQYSCQKNFALLSTDGYWNGSDGYQLDGSTKIGNQDSSEPRPYNDGGSASSIYTATLVVSATNSSSNVTSIKVEGIELLSGTATAAGGGTASRSEKLAASIANKITNGFTVSRFGTTITLTAPNSTSALPVITMNGGASVTTTAFAALPVTSGGTEDTLADVAAYYYKTDLRTSTATPPDPLSINNVQAGGDDDAPHQHMSTYTLGLGAPGRMTYSPTYKNGGSAHFEAIKSGLPASGGQCPWQSSGTCTWPEPDSSGVPENIDDLWHAAVNGRGTYFSATDAGALAAGLLGALKDIQSVSGDSAAASTSNPNLSVGDNFVFSSTFSTVHWTGELERRQIDPSSGALASTADWTAASQLETNTSRTIYTFDSATGSTTKVKPFTWASLSTAEQAYFTSSYIGTTATPILSQFCSVGDNCVDSTTQTAAGGEPLVNYLRGDRSNEGTTADANKPFRQRKMVLGDIVNSEAVYVKLPQQSYVDAGYSAFKTSGIATTRPAMVYVGANDGMLHAFNATTGVESWAYVPKLVLPTLYRLADKSYSTKHQYYVDGSPTVGDVYIGSAWRTILVGGLNGGGRGYYALDVTDPANPKALWEFTDTNMGYTYGRPEIAKLANGTWVVMFTSGYNNVNPGNGKGYLYVVNAQTGANLFTKTLPVTGEVENGISTGTGSVNAITGICATAPCPSGLAQIRAYVDNSRYNNTATRVYGGDLFGNLWRFDINDTLGSSGVEAQELASLRGPSGGVQSITARPELGLVEGYPVVYVGTGRYLGASDLQDTSVQSLYAIKDTDASTSYNSPRSNTSAAGGTTGFVKQTMTAGTCGVSDFCVAGTEIRTGSSTAVNMKTHSGWYMDLIGTGERANTDPQLALGTLVFTTNVIDASACSPGGGKSFLNFLDYRSGKPVTGSGGIISSFVDTTTSARAVAATTTDATTGQKGLSGVVRDGTGETHVKRIPFEDPSRFTRRTSWRELIAQ